MECLKPLPLKNEFGDIQLVPCSKCASCLKRRVSGWAFRLYQELKESTSSYFITLTYDTRYIPITESGEFSLSKKDVQDFMKRLRDYNIKAGNKVKLKYYAVGEYGPNTLRPHYHMILFNSELELIQPAWDMGNVNYGYVQEASIAYTLKYMCKKAIVKKVGDDRQKEFSLMSKGLGKAYTENKQIVDYHNNGEVGYCTLKDGKKISMPRYYKEKIFSEYKRQRVGKKILHKMLQDDARQRELIGSYEYDLKKMHSRDAEQKKFDYQNRLSKRAKI